MQVLVNKFVTIALLVLFSFPVFSKQTYTIARAPQSSYAKTEKAWTPYIQYLNKTTDYSFKLKLYNERKNFEQDIKSGAVDFYFGNPGYAIVGHLNHGYIPIIRSDKKKLQGIIVTAKDSSLNKVSDLQGKKLVFPGKTAFAASLLIRHYLLTDFGVSVDQGYVFGHDNVYKNVLNGNYVAGGGVMKTLNREPEVLRKKLKIIYKTPEISSHPLMIHPSVSAVAKNKIIENTLALDKSDYGKKILKKMKLIRPVVSDYMTDYKSLEVLTKKLYKHLLLDK